jgi:ADP-ribosylglycohydrolase
MRVASIGLLYWKHREQLLEVARASSLLTHGHNAAVEGAAAAALLVALALEEKTPQDMFDEVLATCGPRSQDFRRCFERLPSLLERDPSEVLSNRGLGEGWVAEEAVASALYCFWRSPRDFASTVLMGANTDGDSDSIACIAGGISGAFNGFEAIPKEWRDDVEGAKALVELSDALYDRFKQTL